MSELTTYANPPDFHGQSVRMAIDEHNMTWWSIDDLIKASTDDLMNKTSARINQARRFSSLLPKQWFKEADGLPTMVNEPGAYYIAYRFNYLDLADWLGRVIVASR